MAGQQQGLLVSLSAGSTACALGAAGIGPKGRIRLYLLGAVGGVVSVPQMSAECIWLYVRRKASILRGESVARLRDHN